MILFGLEEFTAKRRTAQEDLEAALEPTVREAVDLTRNTNGWSELLDLVAKLYSETYNSEAGTRGEHPLPKGLRTQLQDTLKETSYRDESSVARISVWLATVILNQATIAASIDDEEELFLEWVTMEDAAVRPAHRAADGQVQPIGDTYSVGGEKMHYPGDPTVSLDLWINCRCTLRPVLASESITAAAFISEKPWSGAASRFTPEQWKSSCVLHVCSGSEKSCHKLPIKEPGGALSRAGVHAAAGRIGSVDASSEQKASAKRALRGAYKQLGEEPPASLTAGGTVTAAPTETPIDEAPPTDDGSVTEPETSGTDPILVPWHGVLAPEGVPSGDGRMFAADSLRMRDLPLPLTWQKASSDGHSGSVTVAKIEKIERRDGMLRGSGYFISNPEADEVMGLLAEFGKFGVSVDADDATFEIDETNEMVVFTSARIASASIVAIPAFAEAYVALGPWDDEDVTDPNDEPVSDEVEKKDATDPKKAKKVANPDETEESLAASAFKDLAPGRTEDGPGWLTNPIDTDRLRDYWVSGPGAAKIGWGVAGDFNRCRLNLAKYVKPQYLNGYCANRHYDALHVWPGQEHLAGEALTDTPAGDAITLVASVGLSAPAAWFRDPHLSALTPLTVTDEGRVFGHLAGWDTCHIGFKDTCTAPPPSASEYAYFRTGEVALDDGTRAATGPITLGGGHAGPRLGLGAAVAHYDSTSSVVADVSMGEDDHGIWFAGWVRPGVSDETVTALRASALSGDWRRVGDHLELVAALAVNTPGFPVPRTQVAASSIGQLSLVASGVVTEPAHSTGSVQSLNPVELAEAVAAALERRANGRSRMAALAARVNGDK